MAKLTPEEAAQKWAQRTGAAGSDWQRGVERVTESPTAKAAASADKWQAKLSDPRAKEKFKRNTSRVSKEEWQAATVAKAGNFTAGAQAAVGKMQKHQQEVAPFLEALKRKIAAMPNNTPQDAANRAAAWVLGMSEYRRPS